MELVWTFAIEVDIEVETGLQCYIHEKKIAGQIFIVCNFNKNL